MTFDLRKGETPPWGGYDFRKKSLAVIACNEHGDGVVREGEAPP